MKITWYGHSAFKIEFGSTSILFDPFLTGSGYTENVGEVAKGVTHICLTHGHSDHVGDTLEIVQQTGATVISNFEVVSWLNGQGVENIEPMNTGGSIRLDGFTVTLVQAFHSSGDLVNGVFAQLGHPNGIIIEAEGEPTVRSEEHTSELQSRENLVCRLLLEKKKKKLRRHVDLCE